MTHPINYHLGKTLRRWRRKRGLTLASLADVAGVCFQQIHKYETGAAMSARTIWTLSRALGVPVGEMFAGLENGCD